MDNDCANLYDGRLCYLTFHEHERTLVGYACAYPHNSKECKHYKSKENTMKKTEYTPKRKWRIECTEEKLRLIASMVEDVTRFIGGQPQLMNCLMMFNNGNAIGEYMRDNVRQMMLPDLDGDCVGWNGRGANNKYVRREVAQGYAAYKSILAGLANEYDWHNVHSGTPLTCEEGGELMNVRPVDESVPEAVDYWTATDPNGKQFTFRSKPVRREWSNGWEWEPSAGGSYIGEKGTTALIELLRLPKLTWDDEPYKFTILKPKRDENK